MKIIFKNICLHNFLSFEDATLKLNDCGYILIQGQNNNPIDLASSNGSGKSALLEAISWCLTGETIRGSKEVTRLNVDDKDNKCFVKLDFEVDDNNYQIYRQTNPSKLSVIVNNEDISGKGIRDTSKILNDYLPDLTTSLIGSVVLLGQGLPQRFTNNTPSGRKEILEKLSKSDFMINDLKNRISNRKKELDDKIREAEDNLLKSNTQKSMYEDDLIKLTERYNNLPDIKGLIYESEQLTKDILMLKDKLNDISHKIDIETNKQNEKLKEKDTILEKFSNEIESLSKPFDLELSELVTSKIELESKIKLLTLEIHKLNSIKDVCPTCGQKLPGVEKPSTEQQEQEINSYQEELQKIKNLMDSKSIEKSQVLSKIAKDKESFILKNQEEYNSININISNLTSFVREFNSELNSKMSLQAKLESEISNYEQNKKDLMNRINQITEAINELNSQILYNNKDKEDIQKHYDIVQKMNSVVTRDFRGYILTSVIDFIDRKAKEYCQEVFESNKIIFQLDGNSISISYDGKEYENLSGGEKQKVDLIIQFSIRDMLCKYLNFSSNIIAVDELFDNLDSVGCERILNLISNRLNDVETVYIITHHSSIPIPFDKIITVVKGEDGISRIS